MGLIMCQVCEQGVKVVFMGFEGVGNKDIIVIVGFVFEGMLVILLVDFVVDLVNVVLVKVFVVVKCDVNGLFQMLVYLVVKIIVDVIIGVKLIDLDKVVVYIYGNSFKIFIGNVEYDKKGDLKVFKFVVFIWYKDVIKIEVK